MLFCSSCGKELPNQANFCWNCGKPQKPGLPIDEPKWETCEIDFEWNGLFGKQFLVAKAISPNGGYEAVRIQLQKRMSHYEVRPSDEFPIPYPQKSTRETFEALVSQLMRDGWEPTSQGHLWYARQFRRRVK